MISKSDTWRLNTNPPTQSLNDDVNIYKRLWLVHPEQHRVTLQKARVIELLYNRSPENNLQINNDMLKRK